MLKDKYTFEHNSNSVYWLHKSLNDSFVANSNTTSAITALALLSLKPFIDRIHKKTYSLDKKKIKVSIKRKEAMAFYILYRADIIDTRFYLISEIFTAIDRTV